MKNRSRYISLILYIVVLVAVFSWANGLFGQKQNTVPYSDLRELFRQEQVTAFLVEGDSIALQLRTPYNGKSTLTTGLADPGQFRQEMQPLFDEQKASGILKSYDFVAEKPYTPYDLILPLLISGAILLFAWTMIMSRMNAGGNPMSQFGKARTVLGVPDNKKVTFDDVAGADEEKQELQEVVDFLRQPEKYTKIGARIPHGL